jgi:hypothetical protein
MCARAAAGLESGAPARFPLQHTRHTDVHSTTGAGRRCPGNRQRSVLLGTGRRRTRPPLPRTYERPLCRPEPRPLSSTAPSALGCGGRVWHWGLHWESARRARDGRAELLRHATRAACYKAHSTGTRCPFAHRPPNTAAQRATATARWACLRSAVSVRGGPARALIRQGFIVSVSLPSRRRAPRDAAHATARAILRGTHPNPPPVKAASLSTAAQRGRQRGGAPSRRSRRAGRA